MAPKTLQGGGKMLPNVNSNQMQNTQLAHRSTSVHVSAASDSRPDSKQGVAHDTISLGSESSLTVTYSRSKQLSAGDEAKYSMLRNLVANLLKEQGISTKIAIGDSEIDLAAISPEDARQLVSEDGYFGVHQTSERIVQFAIGIAGGDPSRIDAIKEGIDKGFAEAKKALGDWLPDISYDTYDAVMTKLDEWVAETRPVA
jgi:hypothetical protein